MSAYFAPSSGAPSIEQLRWSATCREASGRAVSATAVGASPSTTVATSSRRMGRWRLRLRAQLPSGFLASENRSVSRPIDVRCGHHGAVFIDTTFDISTDTPPGEDPDTWSPTARRYHQALWSKPLPDGSQFDLVATPYPPYRFEHRSATRSFVLTSDAFIPTYTRYVATKHIISQLDAQEQAHFNALAYTIGGLILWPANKVDNKQTINQARGWLRSIGDRMDLTLECIRRHYEGTPSPLAEVLARYADFFAAFENFQGYVDFWLLQDMVTEDYASVRFFLPFDDFSTSPIPQDVASYQEYQRSSIEFVEARNRRISRASAAL